MDFSDFREDPCGADWRACGVCVPELSYLAGDCSSRIQPYAAGFCYRSQGEKNIFDSARAGFGAGGLCSERRKGTAGPSDVAVVYSAYHLRDGDGNAIIDICASEMRYLVGVCPVLVFCSQYSPAHDAKQRGYDQPVAWDHSYCICLILCFPGCRSRDEIRVSIQNHTRKSYSMFACKHRIDLRISSLFSFAK